MSADKKVKGQRHKAKEEARDRKAKPRSGRRSATNARKEVQSRQAKVSQAHARQDHDQAMDIDPDLMQIEGKNPVIEALKAGQQVDRILIADGARQVEEIKELASERGVKYQFVSRDKINQIATTKANQGVLAYMAAVQYTNWHDWLDQLDMESKPIVIMLAELQDPHNVGSIVRTAESAGLAGVILAKHRAAGLTATVAKVSAGALSYMPMLRVTNLAQTLKELKDKGFWVVGTDAKGQDYYYEVDYDMPTVLVIGSEGKGLGPVLEKECDFLIKIPMLGQVTSLNASVAAGIMTYEIIKQRQIKESKGKKISSS